jgi:hypothetical protein
VRNFRQALASPHPGLLAGFHDPCAAALSFEGGTMITVSRLVPVAVLTAVLVSGCAARSVQIGQLKNDLDRYDDKTVRVTGVVTNSFGIPLVPFQVYNVDDGTGSITVLSRSGRAPSKGARVQVTGKINEFGTFGGRSLGLHIEESDRKFRG